MAVTTSRKELIIEYRHDLQINFEASELSKMIYLRHMMLKYLGLSQKHQ